MDSLAEHSRSITAPIRPSDPSDTSSFNTDWVQARPHILAALEYVSDRYDEASVLRAALRGDAVLWVGDRSAVVTEIIEYPTGLRTCLYWLAGGDLGELRDRMAPAIERWARETYGAKQTEYSGRRGWIRALGFKERWTSGAKDL